VPRICVCAQCHCYVCDCVASECDSWGDGALARAQALTARARCLSLRALSSCVHAGLDDKHHCHAHAGDRAWQAARQARQAAANPPPKAAAPTAQWGAPPPPRAPPPVRSTVLPAGHVRTPPDAPEPLPVRARRSVLCCRLLLTTHFRSRLRSLALPAAASPQDPATLPGLLHLAQLRLPVKATKGNTLEALQARLAPHGVCTKDYYSAHTGAPAAGSAPPPLTLRTLLETTMDYAAGACLWHRRVPSVRAR
jgi:hypothetical protein